MNNNVVEKTLKSIDNIDRLSDLAAISIYNTSHEAIDKFDVMQEHATPEYVEGEFVQESLLTGVLIGAGIIGVAISAFLIIKKIIESKAKGDPNAAPNTVAGVNLLNPDEINKLFDGWNDKYFKNHPDLVAEDVPGADVSELNTYNGLLLESIRKFCDDATKMIDGLNELSDADMKVAIDDLNKEFDSNINMNELVSKTGRVDKNTILQIKAAAEDISKTLREFDMQVTKCIEGFRNKEKDNQNSGSDTEENKISEENIKLLEKALKAKANTASTIMVNFRNKCLDGIAQALDAKVKEAEGQAKAKQQQEQQKHDSEKELTPLTDADKKSIIDVCVKLIKMGYPQSDEDISNSVKERHTASSEDIQEIIDAVRAKTKTPEGTPKAEPKNQNTDGASAETETPETENAEKKEETETKQSSVDSTKNVLNDDALLTAYADKRFGGNKEQARQHAEYLQKLDAKTFKNNIMKQVFVNVLIDHKQSGLNEAIDDIYNNYMSDFKDANISPDESMNDINAIHLSEDEINKLRQIFSRLNIGKNFSDKYFCQRLADMIKDNSGNEFDAAMNRLESGFPPFNDIKDFKTEIEQNMRVFNKQFSDNPEENDLNNIQFTITNMSMDGLFNWAKQKYDTPYAVNRYELACKIARNALHLNDKFVPKPKELNGETPESEEPSKETAKDKNAERPDKVNITPEMEEKMKEVLLSAGEISQYGAIDESVVNHEIRQIKDMGLFKWTSSQYGDPNNVMSEQQDRCVKINTARYNAAYNLAEVMGIDPDLVPKPTPLEQATTPTENQNTDEASAEETKGTPETSEETPETEPEKTEETVDKTEKKDETPSSENANQNIDIQYDGNWVIINGKPVAYSDEEDDNIERKWPDEDNETANKLITGLINRGESPLNAIEDINDLWEYGSRDGNIINFLNGIYSSRNSLDNPNDLKIRTECYNKCKIMAEILGEPPVDELPKPDSVEKPSDDIKKISDSTGLDEGKVENIYKILKDNSTPDDVKRALIIDTIRPIMHMSGFNEDMTNKSFATNYANFKKVAEAANMPFEIELPKISEKDINDMHTIVDGAGTDETKLAKIADNLMNSTSTEKKDAGAEGDKEQELLSRITNGPTFAAEVAKAVDAGIPEDYARTTLSSLTMSDGKYSLIKERLKDYDWLNDFKQREAYKNAYNHYNDALLYFTDKGIRDIPELKDELPDPTVEFPNALNDENVMQRVLAQYPVNPETLRKDLEYFNTHIPDENLRYIIKDIIPKYFLENAFTKSFEETVNQIRNDDINVLKLAMINANIAEFKPSPEILKQVTDYINANLEKLKSRMTCTILADALVYGTFDPGMIDSETESGSPKSTDEPEPKAQPSSPSNSSTGSRTGSKQQPTARPTATKQGTGSKQPVRKPVNKPGSGSKQQPTKKPKQGLFGKIFGI